MADAQIELRTGSMLLARNAAQAQITALSSIPPIGFVHIGDVTIAVDLIASAYMLDAESVPAESGHRYTEADLTTEG